MTQPTEETREMGNVKALKAENERLREALLTASIDLGATADLLRAASDELTPLELDQLADELTNESNKARLAALKGGE